MTGPLLPDSTWVQEGRVKFQTGSAFYRSKTQLARDLGVLAAAVYRRQTGALRVLDAATGCGVRALRYALESDADFVWANEGNPEHQAVLHHNLSESLAIDRFVLTHESIARVLSRCIGQQDYYDWVDLDTFGNPSAHLALSLQATQWGGCLYLTSTDGRSISGHSPHDSLRTLGAYARSHPAIQEQAVRILIGAALQQAGALGYTIEPVFSLYQGQTYRVLLRVLAQARNPEPNYGFLGYCAHCGQFAMPSWRYLSRSTCALGHGPLCLTGPLWLGSLHDVGTLALMRALAIEWGWGDRVAYLDLLRGEAELPPYHFSLGEMGRRGKLDVPQRDHLIQALRDRGYEACATQFAQDAIKTTAGLAVCIDVARVLLKLKTQP